MTVKPGDFSLRPARVDVPTDFSVIERWFDHVREQGMRPAPRGDSVRRKRDQERAGWPGALNSAGTGIDERRRIAMFAAAECMFMYLESSLRVGSGEERLEVDLPIQREAATGYPLLPGSSLKGVLRAAGRSKLPCRAARLARLRAGKRGKAAQQRGRLRRPPAPVPGPLLDWSVRVGHQLETWSRFQRALAAYGVSFHRRRNCRRLPPRSRRGPRVPLLCRSKPWSWRS